MLNIKNYFLIIYHHTYNQPLFDFIQEKFNLDI